MFALGAFCAFCAFCAFLCFLCVWNLHVRKKTSLKLSWLPHTPIELFIKHIFLIVIIFENLCLNRFYPLESLLIMRIFLNLLLLWKSFLIYVYLWESFFIKHVWHQFWNTFFEGAISKRFNVLKHIFWESNYFNFWFMAAD